MKSKLLAENGERTYALIFDEGDEALAGLLEFARQQKLGASHFTGIGALREAVLGYFQPDKKQYKQIPVREQVEVLTLNGDITIANHQRKVHAHVVLGTGDGSARGGHLLQGIVRPTLEVILTESPKHLYRQFNEAAGVALIKL